LSAIARVLSGGMMSEPPRSVSEPPQSEDEGASSVMPKAPSVPPPAEAASLPPAAAEPEPPYMPTPASMVPTNEGPEISVGVLSMPHLRVERPSPDSSPLATPAPVLIPMNPAPVLSDAAPAPQKVLTLTPGGQPKAASNEVIPAEEPSGVRHVLLRNEPGIVREVCGGTVYNSCS
jgi:hypothetical protein